MMVRNKITVFVLAIALIILSACTMAAQPSAVPTLDLVATQAWGDTATANANTKATADMQATGAAKATTDTQGTASAVAIIEATSKAQTQAADYATATQIVRKTQAAEDVTNTAIAKTATSIARATNKAQQATEQASGMFEQVQWLYDEGFIKTTEGSFYKMDDFDESWAQIGWYRWWPTKYSPKNFVIMADATWESASKTANFDESGCGFVFHAEDVDNHLRAFLAMDGYVYMNRFKGGVGAFLGSGYYGRFEIPSDSAQIMLVAENGTYTFFVNDIKVFSRKDTALYKGELALTLASGTNKDWGTRCIMKNIELWEMP
jgi:hypothetical protein